MRERSVLERMNSVRESNALSRTFRSGIEIWNQHMMFQSIDSDKNIPLEARSLTKGVFCTSAMLVLRSNLSDVERIESML